ncbi:MAG: cellulase family glycosylhydrolase, partial [Anaerolineae bacterium]|nr:cellulase family glycosylhydrolase [Anaerolineae bacterium]
SDPGPYPIPPDAPIEGGRGSDGDRHVLIVDRDHCMLYELYDAWPQPDGSWHAGSGAIFDLNSNALRPAGWTSADAAGLPILPGLVRYDEVAAGEIRHAIRFTAPRTRKAYVWPARHYASDLTAGRYPPMGQRFRLRADFDISGFSPQAQVILQALKRYGMILADNGRAWFISGAPDDRWDNDVLHELHQVHGTDFEAVDASSLIVHPDSAQARASASNVVPSSVALTGGKWALWTGSTKLRGANIYQRRVYPDLDGSEFMGSGAIGPPYTQADFDRLAALGANYVNISHPGLFSETEPYTVDAAAQANLDDLLAKIAKADMFAVITFRTGPGRSEFWAFWGEDDVSDPDEGWFPPSYYNNRVWGDRAAQDAWVAMWRYTAARYKDNPVVIGYDLMCEPNSNEVGSYPLGDPLDIWDPQEFYDKYGGTLYDWNQLYPRITAAIREVDPDTPILIGGMAYSRVDWLPYLQPTGDPHTVYTVHQYEPMAYTHQTPPDLVNTYPGVFDTDWDGKPDQFDRAWLEEWLAPVDAFISEYHVPVAVNEYGVMRWEPGADQFMRDEMDLFERRGMNYALWLWETSWLPYATEVDAFNFRHGPDPGNHADVPSSELLETITSYWRRNVVRPSLVSDEGTRYPFYLPLTLNEW